MKKDLLESLGISSVNSGVFADGWIEFPGGEELASIDPSSGEPIARVRQASLTDYERVMGVAQQSFLAWRQVPAPVRGEFVRRLGNRLREKKSELGQLVTFEVGKIRSEGEGEVQEMIDMCDYAVGLSRQLSGLSMVSERPRHRLLEQWHPLGPVGIITAFNFPVAVWAWNATLAAVCGDSMIWKPSPLAPLTAIAVQNIVVEVSKELAIPPIMSLCIGPTETVGQALVADRRVPLISATGSCAMGRQVASVVGARLGRTLLELGGNNAVIVSPKADLSLALRAVLFSAVGTAGQRCTTLRRLILHESIADDFVARLKSAYESVVIGNPMDPGTLLGPLIRPRSVDSMMKAIERGIAEGATVVTGGKPIDRAGYFVEPTIMRVLPSNSVVAEETFAPLLYVMTYRELDEAIEIQNSVAQGLSSSIITDSVREMERFLSAAGSDCGLANVNMGTSGAEIGGAFGGEKETGGGREAGSDSWKAYMRRQTSAINDGADLPLAQGVRFDTNA